MNKTLPLALLAALGPVQSARALMIDDFSTFQISEISAAAPAAMGTSQAAVEAIGGERDIWVTKTVGADGERVRARVNPMSAAFLRVSIDDAQGRVALTWDGNDGDASSINYAGLGGINLLANAGTQFDLGVEKSDIAGPLRITVFDAADLSGATFASGTVNVAGGILSADPTVLYSLLFGSMSASAGTVNGILANAGAIQLEVDASAAAQESWDINLSFFGTNAASPVPAPAVPLTLALVVMGLITRRQIG